MNFSFSFLMRVTTNGKHLDITCYDNAVYCLQQRVYIIIAITSQPVGTLNSEVHCVRLTTKHSSQYSTHEDLIGLLVTCCMRSFSSSQRGGPTHLAEMYKYNVHVISKQKRVRVRIVTMAIYTRHLLRKVRCDEALERIL